MGWPRKRPHLIRSRSHEDPRAWRPAHTINLTGNPNITSATYAKLIADTYTSLNKSSSGDSFWPTAAQLIIQHCLDALRLTNAPVTIPRVAGLIKSTEARAAVIASLSASYHPKRKLSPRILYMTSRSRRKRSACIIAHVDNFLATFLNPWISEVFCAEIPDF